jgi:hypothetical protein
MSFTNCLANFAGLLAPMAAGHITDKRVSWHMQTVNMETMLRCTSTLVFTCHILCRCTYNCKHVDSGMSKINEHISGAFCIERSVRSLLNFELYYFNISPYLTWS